MQQISRILLLLLACTLIMPVVTADTGTANMLKQYEKGNATLPQKGTALLGTKESMTETASWLNAWAEFFNTFTGSILKIFGMGTSDAGTNLTKSLTGGVRQAKGGTGK